MIALIDGDVCVYKAGFVAESRKPSLFLDMNGKSIGTEIVVQPLSVSLGVFKKTIEHTLKVLGTDRYLVFLTDTKLQANFRYKIDNQYKANRKKSVKPVHYEAIRKYAIKRHPTILVSGEEADDALGIKQYESDEETTICSIDKDLLMIEGNHYNFNTGELLVATDPGYLWLTEKNTLKGYGFVWFTAQLLLGDIVDNINGLRGYGPVKTFKYLNFILDPFKPDREVIRNLWVAIEAIYPDKEALHRNASLLWIRRKPNQTYEDFLNEHI